jgi:RimJ/RimL family protein N-acetyltransferase
MEADMFHRTERLLLRPVFEEDWEDIYRGLNDEGVVRMLCKAPWPYREEDARASAARPAEKGLTRFAITLPGAGGSRMIGTIGIGDPGEGPEIGYWIARPFWGRGYATEAGRGILSVARMLGHRTIRAAHAIDNPASGKVLRKLGFRPTGETCTEHSAGRGGDMQAICYAKDLDAAESDDDPSVMPKAA